MQPITQPSLDPKMNDIRHLRADQEFCGVIGCFGLITPKTLGQPVCRTANALTDAIQNVRVNHGRTNVAVPQKFLNGSNGAIESDLVRQDRGRSQEHDDGRVLGRLHRTAGEITQASDGRGMETGSSEPQRIGSSAEFVGKRF